MRLFILVNPQAARAGPALNELAAWFKQNCEATFVKTRSRDHLTKMLLRHGPDHDRIVIGGGDGTISDALPHLLTLGKPLSVLPLGTANDFARSLGMPLDAFAAAQIACDGSPHKVDVGVVNGRPFLNVASVGVAAVVSQVQSTELKRSWRLWSYVIGLLADEPRSRQMAWFGRFRHRRQE
jgi:diacylglycerol kinase family enzyme